MGVTHLGAFPPSPPAPLVLASSLVRFMPQSKFLIPQSKCLAQSNKSPDVGNATKKRNPPPNGYPTGL
jgi:hypothetical protein